MANKFWRTLGHIGGQALNGLVPGEVYNKYNRQWAPTGVMAPRVAAGVAGHLAGSAGSLAGMVTNHVVGNTPEGFTFDQGVEGYEGMMDDFEQSSEQNNDWMGRLRPSVPTMGPNLMPPGLMNGFNPNSFATSQPQSGIPQQQTSYGLSLPNFAQPQQQVASAGGSAMGGSGQGGGGGLGGNGSGGLGMGNVGMLGTTRRYGQIKHS